MPSQSLKDDPNFAPLPEEERRKDSVRVTLLGPRRTWEETPQDSADYLDGPLAKDLAPDRPAPASDQTADQ